MKWTDPAFCQRIIRLYQQGSSGGEITRILGVKLEWGTSVYRVLHKAGISPRALWKAQKQEALPPKRGRFRFTQVQEREIAKKYRQGTLVHELSTIYICSVGTITRLLNRQDIPRHRTTLPPRQFTPKEQRDILARWDKGQAMNAIRKVYGLGTDVPLRRLLMGNGRARPPRSLGFKVSDAQMKQIWELWHTGLPLVAIARAVNLRPQTVRAINKFFREGDLEFKRPGREWQTFRESRGRHIEGNYIRVHLTPKHPFYDMCNKAGYIAEHRLVMAQKLGRLLLPSETVHHINGDGFNNALSNLQLRTGRHGKGAAYRCADCGSFNIVPVEIGEAKD